MVACPAHINTLLSRLPEADWPKVLPDGSSTPPPLAVGYFERIDNCSTCKIY